MRTQILFRTPPYATKAPKSTQFRWKQRIQRRICRRVSVMWGPWRSLETQCHTFNEPIFRRRQLKVVVKDYGDIERLLNARRKAIEWPSQVPSKVRISWLFSSPDYSQQFLLSPNSVVPRRYRAIVSGAEMGKSSFNATRKKLSLRSFKFGWKFSAEESTFACISRSGGKRGFTSTVYFYAYVAFKFPKREKGERQRGVALTYVLTWMSGASPESTRATFQSAQFGLSGKASVSATLPFAVEKSRCGDDASCVPKSALRTSSRFAALRSNKIRGQWERKTGD